MENVLFFMIIWNFVHMAIRNNLWQFGIVCGHLVYFSHFGMFGPRKIWQPWLNRGLLSTWKVLSLKFLKRPFHLRSLQRLKNWLLASRTHKISMPGLRCFRILNIGSTAFRRTTFHRTTFHRTFITLNPSLSNSSSLIFYNVEPPQG
jgi:hypothetical protein